VGCSLAFYFHYYCFCSFLGVALLQRSEGCWFLAPCAFHLGSWTLLDELGLAEEKIENGLGAKGGTVNNTMAEERHGYKTGYTPSTDSDMHCDRALDAEKYGESDAHAQDKGEVFGDETNKQVKYRTMEWWHAALVMIAETISLGILSLPSSMAGLGLVAGIILIVGLGAISTYTGYVFWQFKMRYPHVHNIADVGEIFAGPVGREIGGFLQTIYLIFIMGSHLLTWTIAMNTITEHGTCTIVWSVVGLILHALLTIPRTLKNVSYLSIFAFISIFSAVMITMVSVGVTRPDPTVHATVTVSFASAFGSVMNIIFAFGGHVAFFSFISELKDPRDFPKALYTLQIVNTTLYVIAAVVIYRFAGPGVASPALGSGSHIIRKITYGISIPTIIIAGVIYGHVASKYIYVRLFRGTRHLHERTWLSYGTWVGILFILWIIAWIIAESVPVFNNLVGLIAALFASWFTYGLAGFMWIYLNWGGLGKNWKRVGLTVVNLCIFALGAASCGLGLWASGLAISQDKSGASWSCEDNGV
jgi:amino acid permease